MKTTIRVGDMSCEHCRMTIQKNLETVPAVLSVSVDLETKTVDVEGSVPENDLRTKISELGYTPE